MEKIVEKLVLEQDRKKHNDIIGVRCCMDRFQKIFTFMRCSLCTKVCPPSCRSCIRSGHLVCNECFAKVKLCPFVDRVNQDGSKVICLAKLEPLHLKLYDKLYEAVDVVLSCAYLDFGCQEMMKEDELLMHQAVCKFRPDFACIITGCNKTRLSGPMLVHHLLKSHNTVVVNSNHDNLAVLFQNVPIVNGQFNIWTPAVFCCYDFNFLLTVRMDPVNENKVQFRFFMLEDEAQPHHFEIHAQLKDANNTGKPFGLWKETPGKLSQMYMTKLGRSEFGGSSTDGFFMELQQFWDNFVFDGQSGMKLMRIEVNIDTVEKQEE